LRIWNPNVHSQDRAWQLKCYESPRVQPYDAVQSQKGNECPLPE
jgi:hypothetical protein